MLPFNWPRWLRSLRTQLTSRGRTYRKPAKRRLQLQLETLEDRRLMATALPGVLPAAVVSNQTALQNGIDPSIVQDPTNPLWLVEVSGSTKSGNTVGALRGRFSIDGGQTWTAFATPATLSDPNLTMYQAPVAFNDVTDVTAAMDRAGNLYISEIEHDDTSTSGALVFQKYTFTSA